MTVNELEQVNSHITASSCIPIEFKNVGGKVINQKLEEGLITIDEKIIYQVRNNIPHMIPEQGIPVPIDFQFSQPEAIWKYLVSARLIEVVGDSQLLWIYCFWVCGVHTHPIEETEFEIITLLSI